MNRACITQYLSDVAIVIIIIILKSTFFLLHYNALLSRGSFSTICTFKV